MSGSAVASPTETTTYTLTAVGDSTPNATTQITVGVDVEAMPLVLNEFVADNKNGIIDADGDHTDWIEIQLKIRDGRASQNLVFRSLGF